MNATLARSTQSGRTNGFADRFPSATVIDGDQDTRWNYTNPLIARVLRAYDRCGATNQHGKIILDIRNEEIIDDYHGN